MLCLNIVVIAKKSSQYEVASSNWNPGNPTIKTLAKKEKKDEKILTINVRWDADLRQCILICA
jgi:hypothetical protein